MWKYLKRLSCLLAKMADVLSNPGTKLKFQFVHIGYTMDAKRPSIVNPSDKPERPLYDAQISWVTDEEHKLKPGMLSLTATYDGYCA